MSDRQPRVHETAVVSPGSVVQAGVEIGPYCCIGPEVEIGEDTVLGPHTVIHGPTRLGKRNRVYGQSSIGSDPQDLKYKGESSRLIIGDENLIREFVTINRGTLGGGNETRIGSGNLLMTGVHVAHDCRVGDGAILANAATLAGHVEVGDYATVGAFSGVHQFCRVGRYAFIGGYSVVTQDTLPFIKTVGESRNLKTYGINTIGLERRGFSKSAITALQKAYRLLLQKGLKTKDAVSQLEQEGQLSAEVEELIRFIESSERGFIR